MQNESVNFVKVAHLLFLKKRTACSIRQENEMLNPSHPYNIHRITMIVELLCNIVTNQLSVKDRDPPDFPKSCY